jgi:ribosomal protein S18 acetylase RimI-like enzyme
LGFIKSDALRHVFALYDIQNDPQHTIVNACIEDRNFKGYILTYTATDVPSVILECQKGSVAELISFAPKDHFVMHTDPNFKSILMKKFPGAKSYVENWMVLKREKARESQIKVAKRLHSRKDAAAFASLVLARKDRPAGSLKKYIEWIARMPIYGVFVEDKLVSYAGSFIQLPEIWLIGGVYTDPCYRSKGYAYTATSAVTNEALRNSKMAALFVRSDNAPAIKVYEKIGYQKIGEKLWLDVGTGLKP